MNLKARVEQAGFGYFIIRSEWDDRCVAYINGGLFLVKDCQMGQAVWEGVRGQTKNIALKNYYTGIYLGFKPGVKVPQMLTSSTNAFAKWNFNVIHVNNRRYPNNKSYYGIVYHTIQNVGTKLCLMVNGDTVSQLNCNPGKPEHLSFEEVKFNPVWQKSPERIAVEKKTAPAVPNKIVTPPAPKPRIVLPKVATAPPVVPPQVVFPPKPRVVKQNPKRNCRRLPA